MRVTLLHNPGAGFDGPDEDELVKVLSKAGHKVAYQSVKKKKWKDALESPGDLVVVAGGDGTVGRALCALAGAEVPVTIFPLGTANNVARSLGISGKPKALVKRWRQGRTRPVNVGRVRGPWGESLFLEAIGFGLFTHSMALVETKQEPEEPQERSTELERDLRFLHKTLAATRARHWGVEVDGQDLSDAYFLLEVLNIPLIGPNIHLAPDADPGDDLLDVVLLGEADRERFADSLLRRIDGKEAPFSFRVVRGNQVQIRWDGSPLRIDDTIHADVSFGKEGEEALVVIELAQRVNVLIPEAAHDEDADEADEQEEPETQRGE